MYIIYVSRSIRCITSRSNYYLQQRRYQMRVLRSYVRIRRVYARLESSFVTFMRITMQIFCEIYIYSIIITFLNRDIFSFFNNKGNETYKRQ